MFNLICLIIILAAVFIFFSALLVMIVSAIGFLRSVGQIFRILLGGR